MGGECLSGAEGWLRAKIRKYDERAAHLRSVNILKLRFTSILLRLALSPDCRKQSVGATLPHLLGFAGRHWNFDPPIPQYERSTMTLLSKS